MCGIICQLLGLRGDSYWRLNYPGQPMLNPGGGTVFLAWCGRGCLALALACLPSAAYLAGDNDVSSIVSKGVFGAQRNMRMLGAAPTIYLFVGVGVWEAFRFLRERFFRGQCDQGGHCRGECNQCRDSGTGNPDLPHLFSQVGGLPPK